MVQYSADLVASIPASGSSVALDTSVAIAVLANTAGALLSESVEQFLLPVPVIGELRYGEPSRSLHAKVARRNFSEGGPAQRVTRFGWQANDR